jgi:hypothetical protein
MAGGEPECGLGRAAWRQVGDLSASPVPSAKIWQFNSIYAEGTEYAYMSRERARCLEG